MTLPDPQSASAEVPAGVLRVLEPADLPDLLALLDRDQDAYCVVAERINDGGLDAMAAGGPTWGWYADGELRSAIYVGANLMPIETTAPARAAFAARLSRSGRRSSAVVGYRSEVLDLWQQIEPAWGPCREVRRDQPLMIISGEPAVEIDDAVKRVEIAELDALLPASIDMFTEEVGISPVAGGRAPAYRARLASTILSGRSYARFAGDEVIFKAEIGAVGRGSCQLQGVWVTPRLRGRGLSVPAIAAVVAAARADHAPRVNLYANHHNTVALHAYERIGFRQIGTFATVLF